MDVPGVTNRFHRLILSWDYFDLCERAEEGSGVYESLRRVPSSFKDIHVSPLEPRSPPGAPLNQTMRAIAVRWMASRLWSPQEYKAVFEPLLLEECGAQVLRGIEEGVVMSPHLAVVSSFERVGCALQHLSVMLRGELDARPTRQEHAASSCHVPAGCRAFNQQHSTPCRGRPPLPPAHRRRSSCTRAWR
jgi:senataxin